MADKESIDSILEEEPKPDKQKKTRDKPDDLISITVNVLYKFDWIILFIITIAYILVVSDFYYDQVIEPWGGLTFLFF